jgi:hypothetical protein
MEQDQVPRGESNPNLSVTKSKRIYLNATKVTSIPNMLQQLVVLTRLCQREWTRQSGILLSSLRLQTFAEI